MESIVDRDFIGMMLMGSMSPLLFRWIKMHLRIKAFYGTSENAVMTQIWIAVSVYVLVAIVRNRLGIEDGLYQILQILSLICSRKPPFYRHFKRWPAITTWAILATN